MTELTETRTAEVVGAEIRNLTAAARYMTVWYAVEIGRRLTEAKELVQHGEWLDWLKRETDFSQPTASRMMKIYAEYGADQKSLFGAETKYATLNNLSISNALRLLAVPEEERESFAAEVDAEHLSARELEAAIRERDEARKQLQTTEARLKDTQRTLAESDEQITDLRRRLVDAQADIRAADEQAEENERRLEEKIKELENRPVEVAVQEPDPDEIERRAVELANKGIAAKSAEAEAKIKEMQEQAKKERDELEKKLKAAEEKAAAAEQKAVEDAGPYKEEAEKARAEADVLRRQLAMSGEAMVTFKLRFDAWQRAWQAMREAMERVPDEQRERCEAAVRAQLAGWAS